jgi:hypothetical protein
MSSEYSPPQDDESQYTGDGDASGSPDAIWPYRNEDQVRKAAKQYGSRNLKQSQRSQIIQRLRKSGALAAAAAPDLLEVFIRQDISARHEILDFFDHILEADADLSENAEELSRHLNEPNFALREKVAAILIKMGTAAEKAATRALGCTRHAVREVQLVGINVLAAIGPVCAQAALPRLEGMIKTVRAEDADMKDSLKLAISSISGTMETRLAVAKASTASQLRRIEQGMVDEFRHDEKPKATKPGEKPPTQVLRMLQHMAKANMTGEEFDQQLKQMGAVPDDVRVQAIMQALAAGNSELRGLAAKIMQLDYIAAIPYRKVIEKIMDKETNLLSRGHIADLLTCIQCEDEDKEDLEEFRP